MPPLHLRMSKVTFVYPQRIRPKSYTCLKTILKRYQKIDWIYPEIDWVYHEVDWVYHEVDFFKPLGRSRLIYPEIDCFYHEVDCFYPEVGCRGMGRNGLGFVRGHAVSLDVYMGPGLSDSPYKMHIHFLMLDLY